MIRTLFALCLSLAPIAAKADPVVVELYTSQGCSSCPPADDVLAELSTRSDVIALSLHVDYWDYIGWEDPYAHAAFTTRQRRYARVQGERMVYTPQMVIGGADHVVGSRPMKVSEMIAHFANQPERVDMECSRSGSTVRVEAQATGGVRPMVLQKVTFDPERSQRVTRGENAGRTIRNHNVVTGWEIVAEWNGQGKLTVDVPAGNSPFALILQEKGQGPVRAAAQFQ